MKGSNLLNQPGVYGTKGVPAAANTPGGRYEPAGWTDQQGNFWLYGSATPSTRSDMWKYDPVTNNWAWMHGTNNNLPQVPVTGTQGIPAAGNHPGSRGWGTISWVDNSGNLWLFGGRSSTANRNDLWKYDIATNMWTWMKGNPTGPSQAGVYGVKGVAAANNNPGGREETSCSWVDNAGNLWMFGGRGLDVNGQGGVLNDLWKYDISTNMWTWMSGDNTRMQLGNYGTKGVAAATNKPGARMVFASWKDAVGNLWMFGGSAITAPNTYQDMNDLWKYDIVTNRWTWMSGSNLGNQPGVYGTKCVPAVSNIPGGRLETRSVWTDECGNFWLFGGTYGNMITQNDLWRYNPATNEWTWVSGDNTSGQPGVYGTQGVSAAGNKPGARSGSIAWKRPGELWLFGGLTTPGLSHYNDIWRYKFDKPTAAFTAQPVAGCNPLTATFTDNSNPNCSDIKSYLWNFGDPASGATNFSTLQNPSHTFAASGTYTIKLVVSNCYGLKDSVTQQVNVFPAPVISASTSGSICIGKSANLSAFGAPLTAAYSWTPANGLSSSTGNTITASPTATTNYTVIATDSNGCKDTASLTVNVHSAIANTTINTTICAGNSYTLPRGNPVSAAGIYNDTLQSISGCDSIIITSLSITPIITTNHQRNICTGSSYTLPDGSIVSTTGIYSNTLLSVSGCDSVITTTLTVGNPINTNTTITICQGQYTLVHGQPQSMAGIYTQTFVALGGCDSVANITLSVSPSIITNQHKTICEGSFYSLPGGSMVNTAGIYNDTLVAAHGCDSIVITALSILPTTTTNQQITICAGNSYRLPNGSFATVTGVYNDTLISSQNCDSIIVTNLTITPLPDINFMASDTTGCEPLCINFTTETSNIQSLQWNFGDGNNSSLPAPSHCYTNEGQYHVSLTITDNSGCTNTLTKNNYITIHGSPTAAFQLHPNPSEVNTLIQFTDLSSGASSWQWSFGDIVNSSSSNQHPTFVYSDSGHYQVQLIVHNNNGCSDTTWQTIYIQPEFLFYVPNTFSPNGDNLNDLFLPKGAGIDPENYALYIFDRWGNEIFQTSDINTGWNGHANNGKDVAQQDTYVWLVKLKDVKGIIHRYVGHINLVR